MTARGTVVVARSLVTLGLLALACAKEDEGSSDDGADASESGGSEAAETGTTGMTAGTGTSTTASSSSTSNDTTNATGSEGNDSVNPDSSGGTSGPADTGSEGPSESTGMQVDPCEPNDMDDACSLCVKDMCCDQVTACVADMDCNCFQMCADSMPNGGFEVIMICGEMCGVADPNDHPTIGPMLSCTTGSCLIQCI